MTGPPFPKAALSQIVYAASRLVWWCKVIVRILDGDAIEVPHNNHAERIRLSGIDCPEKGQAHGHKAKEAASTLVFSKDVTLRTYGRDKYGRTLATGVALPHQTGIHPSLPRHGLSSFVIDGPIEHSLLPHCT